MDNDEICFLATTSRLVLGPTQPLHQLAPGALIPGVKWPGHEADPLPLSSGKVKNVWSYASTPSMSSWHGA